MRVLQRLRLAGAIMAEKVADSSKLDDVLKRAVDAVLGGTTAVIDAVVAPGC